METKMNKYAFLPNILKMVFITPLQWLRLQNDEEAVEIAKILVKITSPVIPESAGGGYPESRNPHAPSCSWNAFDFAQGGEPVEPRISTPSRPV